MENKVRDANLMDETYGKYYAQNYSFRENWFGPIAKKYIIPKYYKLLAEFIGDRQNVSILEIGAGDGEVTDYIKQQQPTWQITPTESVQSGVDALVKKGHATAQVVDAVSLPFPDKSYDFVTCFDVMHHVTGPATMAHEMMRVAKDGVFMVEANRQAITRRLLEKTQVYKNAGEFSYFPKEYKAFFNQPAMKDFSIHPFQFIPPKLSNLSVPLTVFISETVEKLPVLRWQCSGVAVGVNKIKTAV